MLVEVEPTLAALSEANAELNGLAGRVRVVALDVSAPARAFAAAGLAPESAMRVLMNPPFNDAGRQRASPDRQRRLAHVAPRAALLPGLVLADDAARPRPEAEAVLRDGQALFLTET